jgi:DNA-binding protein H-NS
MALSDKIKRLTKKAEVSAAEHGEQLHQAVTKAEAAADQRTGGQYHQQIQQAGAKADELIERVKQRQSGDEAQPPGAAGQDTPEQTPPRAG